jgi:hypothetical protein
MAVDGHGRAMTVVDYIALAFLIASFAFVVAMALRKL